MNLNRNRKSLTLNLKFPQGKKIFLALTQTAQVVLEGFRPGVVTRLGIDYLQVEAVNPQICDLFSTAKGFNKNKEECLFRKGFLS